MRARRAFSVAELIVAIAVVTVVGGAIATAMQRQQQVFRSIALMVGGRADVRDAAEVLASDLSSATPLDTIALAADSAVEFYSTIAHSVSCDSAPGYTLRLPPEKTVRALRVTSMLATPDTGDIVLVYVQDGTVSEGARWDRHSVAVVASQQAGTACPASTGFTMPADAASPSKVITLHLPASDSVRAGAPVRVIRRVRYSLYRSSDSRWYLGNRRCIASGPSSCGVIQPVSGPYAAYAAGTGGLVLRYADAGGALLSPADASWGTARIDIAVRGRPSTTTRPGHAGSVAYHDSAATVVALRNRD